MPTATVAAVTMLLESLPESAQLRVAEHLREYMEQLRSELQWDESFAVSESAFIAAAQRAKEDIRKGLAKPLDFESL